MKKTDDLKPEGWDDEEYWSDAIYLRHITTALEERIAALEAVWDTSDDTTFAARLRMAMGLGKLSLRAVSDRLKADTTVTSNYTSVWAWTNGQREPHLDVVVGLAQVCGVRAAWLAVGQGKP